MKKILLALALSFLLTSSVSAAEFNTNLKYGSKGNDVTRLQEFLTEQGLYNGPITGNFFSLTLKAVKAFQARESITPVSGFFGSLTRAKVNEILDNQLTESNVAEVAEPVAEPVVVAPAPVSAEVLRLNEILGAVQAQNQLLQGNLDLQRAEADRIKARQAAETEVLRQAEVARQQAQTLAQEQAAAEARKPLYTSDQLKAKYLNFSTGGRDVLLFVRKSPLTPVLSDKQVYTGRPDGEVSTVIGWTTDISFSRSGPYESWGDAIVVFNGQTVLSKDKDGATITGLDASKHYSYQIIYPAPGREDSVYEGTI